MGTAAAEGLMPREGRLGGEAWGPLQDAYSGPLAARPLVRISPLPA